MEIDILFVKTETSNGHIGQFNCYSQKIFEPMVKAVNLYFTSLNQSQFSVRNYCYIFIENLYIQFKYSNAPNK